MNDLEVVIIGLVWVHIGDVEANDQSGVVERIGRLHKETFTLATRYDL